MIIIIAVEHFSIPTELENSFCGTILFIRADQSGKSHLHSALELQKSPRVRVPYEQRAERAI